MVVFLVWKDLWVFFVNVLLIELGECWIVDVELKNLVVVLLLEVFVLCVLNYFSLEELVVEIEMWLLYFLYFLGMDSY